MKNYYILKNIETEKIIKAKKGFSWTAFFFTWIWAFTHKFPLLALSLLSIFAALSIFKTPSYIWDFIIIYLHFVMGIKGSEAYKDKLIKSGYFLKEEIR